MPMTDAQRAAKKRKKARRKERKRAARQAQAIHDEVMYMTSPKNTARQFLKDSTR